MSMRVIVDKELCIGAGQCVVTAPDVFDQDDDGIVDLLTDSPAEGDRDAVKEAEHVCPARVISVED
ncbi:Ferredoxin [Pseudonocardia sp. Ae717_Ps2]|jgi:ferredoxin|nr:Ferredoxin [Pseudonocardia sp. Ae717_Ps2]